MLKNKSDPNVGIYRINDSGAIRTVEVSEEDRDNEINQLKKLISKEKLEP